MKLTRWIRAEELEKIVQNLEEVLGLELSVVGPEGDILAGRLLPRGRAGIEELPIQVGGVVSGTLRCGGHALEPARIRQAAELVAALLTREAEAQRTKRDLVTSLAHTWKELHFLYEMSASLRVTMSIEQTCELILGQLVKLMDVERASIMLFGDDGYLYIQAARGIPADVIGRTRIRVGDGICGWVAQHERAVLVEDVRRPPTELSSMLGRTTISNARSFLSVPLHTGAALRASSAGSGGRLIGVLNLTDRHGDEAFTGEDLNLVSAVGAQAAIAIENTLLVQKARLVEKLDDQMEVASRLQRAFLPRSDPGFAGLEIWGHCEPGGSVTGDYFDFFSEPGSDLFRAVIADASISGISGALLMSSLRASIRALHSVRLAPTQMAERLNQLLCEDVAGTGMFGTVLFLEYDRSTVSLLYTSAGHGPALLCHPSGETRLLASGGMAVGVVAGTAYSEERLDLQPGDVLALCTDGLLEARRPDGEGFGTERLAEVLGKNRDLPVRQIVRAVFAAVHEFCGSAKEHDDQTLVVLRVDEPPLETISLPD